MTLKRTTIGLFLSLACMQTVATAQNTSAIPGEARTAANKGHFMFGTNLPNYSIGTVTQNGGTNGHSSQYFANNFSTFGFSLNIYAGYFITDDICVGINFNSNNNAFSGSQFYNSTGTFNSNSVFNSIAGNSLFFRYYLIDDSLGLNLYVEGNIGVGYTSGNYKSGTVSSTAPSEPASLFAANTNLTLALAYNVSRHFAIPLKLGVVFNYSDINIQPYSGIAESNANLTTFSFVASLGVEYKL